jgi:hypothetical protein
MISDGIVLGHLILDHNGSCGLVPSFLHQPFLYRKLEMVEDRQMSEMVGPGLKAMILFDVSEPDARWTMEFLSRAAPGYPDGSSFAVTTEAKPGHKRIYLSESSWRRLREVNDISARVLYRKLKEEKDFKNA